MSFDDAAFDDADRGHRLRIQRCEDPNIIFTLSE